MKSRPCLRAGDRLKPHIVEQATEMGRPLQHDRTVGRAHNPLGMRMGRFVVALARGANDFRQQALVLPDRGAERSVAGETAGKTFRKRIEKGLEGVEERPGLGRADLSGEAGAHGLLSVRAIEPATKRHNQKLVRRPRFHEPPGMVLVAGWIPHDRHFVRMSFPARVSRRV